MGKREHSSKDKKKRKRIKIEGEQKNDKSSSSSSEEEIAVVESNNNIKNNKKKKIKFESTTATSITNNGAGSSSKKAFFLKKKIDINASLLPASLHNCEEAVEDSIRELLMKYSDGLGGILMGYENVRLKQGGGRGWVLNELPHIHYSASCDALVFCPAIGCEVGGKKEEKKKTRFFCHVAKL